VDQHQPVYWLSRDPAEAAQFLARTAVASRAVGGFIKTAQGMPALDPNLQRVLTHAAIGAGIGGFGGLGVGLFSKRKKNPLTSALTGAVLGGVAGGAVPEAWRAWNQLSSRPSATQAQRVADQQAAADKAWNEASGAQKLYARATGSDITVDPTKIAPTGAAGAAAVPQTAKDKGGWGQDIGQAAREGASAVGQGVNTVTGASDRPWTVGTAMVGATGLSGEIWRRQHNARLAEAFRRGAADLKPVDPARTTPGYTPEEATRLLHDEMSRRTWDAPNPFRGFQESRIGRIVGKLRKNTPTGQPGNVPPRGLADYKNYIEGSHVRDTIARGMRDMTANPLSRTKRWGGLALRVSPFLLPAYMKATEPSY
jgi:hypothetical protein